MVVGLCAKRFNITCHLALPLIKETFFPKVDVPMEGSTNSATTYRYQ